MTLNVKLLKELKFQFAVKWLIKSLLFLSLTCKLKSTWFKKKKKKVQAEMKVLKNKGSASCN